MELLLSKSELLSQLSRQLHSFFELSEEELNLLENYIDVVLKRLNINLLSKINVYQFLDIQDIENEENSLKPIVFNPFHTVQYMIFLYYFSNSIWKSSQNSVLSSKIYYLNKIMNGVDLFYEIELPDSFGAEHPVGSIMGRATYGEDFYFYQGCTVGITVAKDGKYNHPILGKNVCMYPNSSILGKCVIGDNVNIGPGTIIKNENIPSNSTVFGISPNLLIKNSYKKYY